jgi:hypothetical protein
MRKRWRECPNFLALRYESLKIFGGPQGGLKAVRNLYLFEDTGDVGFHRMVTEAELIRNLLV